MLNFKLNLDKSKIILVVIILGLLVLLYFVYSAYKDKSKENDRNAYNYKVMNTNYKYWKTDAGDKAVTIQALQLREKEANEKEKEDIKDMGVKDPAMYASISTNTTLIVPAQFHIEETRSNDSTKKKPCFDYKDEYTEIHTCVNDSMYFSHTDSISIASETIYKHSILWGLIKWRKIGTEYTVKNKCPYSTINYSKFIEFQ